MRRILRISLAILIALAMSTHNFVSASKLQLDSSKGKLLPQIVEKIEESDSSENSQDVATTEQESNTVQSETENKWRIRPVEDEPDQGSTQDRQDEKSVGDESDDQDPNRSEKANSATGLQGKIEKNGDQEADDDGAGDEQEPTHGEKARSSDDLQGKGEDQEADGDDDSDNRGADNRGASDRTEEESDQAGKDDGADDDSSDSDEGGAGRRGVDRGEREVQGLNDGDVDSDDSDEAEPRERGARQRERTADFGGGGDGDDDDDDEGKAGQKKGDDDDDDDDDDEGKAGQKKGDDDEDEDDDDDDDGDSRRRDSEGAANVSLLHKAPSGYSLWWQPVAVAGLLSLAAGSVLIRRRSGRAVGMADRPGPSQV